ncbi:hypothetical protein Tco_0940988 [Tanacetum coccineum]|uniref:Uncharacterized protein n=1 Tax=Tanacetum coccineum TaxID=301880 RepID=A0ABQ5DQG3_9ASTR
MITTNKGKGVLVEEEPEKPEKVKRRDQGLAQIESDAELAQRLHAEEIARVGTEHEKKDKSKKKLTNCCFLAKSLMKFKPE